VVDVIVEEVLLPVVDPDELLVVDGAPEADGSGVLVDPRVVEVLPEPVALDGPVAS